MRAPAAPSRAGLSFRVSRPRYPNAPPTVRCWVDITCTRRLVVALRVATHVTPPNSLRSLGGCWRRKAGEGGLLCLPDRGFACRQYHSTGRLDSQAVAAGPGPIGRWPASRSEARRNGWLERGRAASPGRAKQQWGQAASKDSIDRLTGGLGSQSFTFTIQQKQTGCALTHRLFGGEDHGYVIVHVVWCCWVGLTAWDRAVR